MALKTLTKGSSSMIDYLDNKRHIADCLAENLTPVSEEDLNTFILHGLDSSYSSFMSTFLMQSVNSSVDDLIGLLLHEEAQIEADLACQATAQHPPAQNPPTTSPFPAAHQVSRHNSTTNNQYAPPSSRNSLNYRGNDSRRRRLHCQLCNKPGHEAINCWQCGNQKDYPSLRPNLFSRDPPRQAHITTDSSLCAIRDQVWYFDTGATDHVSPDLSKLHINEQYTGDDKLQVGNDNNVFIELWPKHCTVKTFQGAPLIHWHVNNGLYHLSLPSSKANTTMVLSAIRTSMAGWHNRLAHPHEAILRRLVSTFNLPTSSNNLGKKHKLPFTSDHISCTKPFKLIYYDVWGPLPMFSINGNRYFVLSVDDYTKFVWIYFLSTKSQVLQTFNNFRTMIKTQFGYEIKSFQSDWGSEFRTISTYLQSCGIHHRISCPYGSEQNGYVERRNRLYSKTPDYAFLRTFGCLCYPFLRPYNTHKMDFRSLPCVFLGYSTSHKGYLCLHTPSSRIYISRHVVFNETIFPFANNTSTPTCSHSTTNSENTPATLLNQTTFISPTFTNPHHVHSSPSSTTSTTSFPTPSCPSHRHEYLPR
ncbi:hypothetical protein LXL04_024766 [Taraxacum kok-saghyz]